MPLSTFPTSSVALKSTLHRMLLLRELLWFLHVPLRAATITTGDAGGLSLCTRLLQLDFRFPTWSVFYNLTSIASARHLPDMIDLVSFYTRAAFK